MARLLGVRRKRPSVGDVAEGAAPRADVAEDHERRRAFSEALGNIRAGRFLANRVEVLLAQDALDVVEARIRARGAHAYPRRLGQRFARHDLDRLLRAFVLYAGFTHVPDSSSMF